MNTNYLKKIANYIDKKQNSLFDFDVKKQEMFLKKFQEPFDDIERSYFQYKCQMKFNSVILKVIFTILSLPLIIIYIILAQKKVLKKQYGGAVFISNGIPTNLIPNSLNEEYDIVVCDTVSGKYLGKSDFKFIFKILKRYPFSWFFLLKSILKIEQYSFIIETYHPKAIIVCSEYSFTSSLLTEYCNDKKITHIDIMHGEKLYYMRDSFFRFNRCYVWNIYYKNLFLKLRAEYTQFIIEIPNAFILKLKTEKKYDYTYYLGGESEEELKSINRELRILMDNGYRISIRPHPRYSNMNYIHTIFSSFNIENCTNISIEESLCRTKNAISLYSTVLNQAYHNGINIIIDDVTNIKHYNKLRSLEYIFIEMSHNKLSEILEGDI